MNYHVSLGMLNPTRSFILISVVQIVHFVSLMRVFHRADCEHIDNIVNPFDWTFTTDYCGTLLGHDDNVLQVRHVHTANTCMCCE